MDLKFVITNDDGYGEPGLMALAQVAQQMGTVVIVAPKFAQSGVGHRVTMRQPLQVEHYCTSNHFVVHGSPADCTRLALKEIAADADWVLADINPGANLGSDVYQSGTVAAVREAAILGTKAIAVSQYIAPGAVLDWEAATFHTARILPRIMTAPHIHGQFWNVNLPSPLTTDAVVSHHSCPLDKYPHNYRYRKAGDIYHYEGIIHDRPRRAGSDVDICFSGGISVTRMMV